MANQSALHTIAANIRAAGSKDAGTGLRVGGIYFPEHNNSTGKRVNAHWEGQFFVNQLGYTDSEGAFHEPKNLPIRITAWNGRNAKDGKGLADIFAKCVSVGKELSAVLRMDHYQKRLFINNVPQVDNTGQAISVPAYGFLIKSDLQWGDDSAGVIAKEVANWTAASGQANFYSRPPQWDIQGTAGNEAWKAVVKQRMAVLFNGETTYGYARVMIPEGATIVNKAGMPITAQIVGQQTLVPPPPGAIVPPPPTAGPTFEQLTAAGWTPEQIQAQPEYAHLVAAVPTSAATGMGASPLTNPAGV